MSIRSRLDALEGRVGITELPPLQMYTYRKGESEEEALARLGLPKLWWNGMPIMYVGSPEYRD